MRPLLPHMNRIAGLLLLASGAYLFYYWARLQFGDTATVADDPIVSFGVRFSGQARNFADGSGSLILVGAGAHRRNRVVRQPRGSAAAAPSPPDSCGSDPARDRRRHLRALRSRLRWYQERSTSQPASTSALDRQQASSRSSATHRPARHRQLRPLFNTRSGEPRLIVLASPT